METTELLFAKVEEHFYLCLTSAQDEEVARAMEKLKASLLEVETHSESAKNYPKLFLEMFQFKAIASWNLWNQTPKLYAAIGEFIHLKNPYEDEFREEVTRIGLGRYLEMVL